MNKAIVDQHPYGIKPFANQLFVSKDLQMKRIHGLGLLNCFKDEILLEILFYLESKELIYMMLSSTTLYMYCHYNDLWRDLALREWELDNTLGIDYMYTWKDTYVSKYCKKNNIKVNDIIIPHKPIKFDGLYSDLLFRTWSCHACDFDRTFPGFLKHDDIKKIDYNSLSVEDFINNYEKPNIPVVIKNGISDWPAFSKWDKEYLINSCGNYKFRATSATAPIAASFTMKEYFAYLASASEEAPLYLFERDFTKVEAIKNDYHIPKYFKKENLSSNYATDLFSLFGESRRPDHKWLIAGPARSGSIFHIDPNQTNAWNAAIKGRKKWIFYPPNVSPPGVMSSEDGADVTVPLSIGEWLLAFWHLHTEARKNLDIHKRPLETILYPGDVIFVPHGYWHMVVNLDDCIALTHNYVSTSNLSDCLRFLREKPDQISGVRDRPCEAIDADNMYEVFLQKLRYMDTMDRSIMENIINDSFSYEKKIMKKKKGNNKNDSNNNEEIFNFNFQF